MSDSLAELRDLWDRAHESLAAAETLLTAGFPDVAASRAYYAVFHGACALLLANGQTFSKHSAVLAHIHQDFVRTGRLPKEMGGIFSRLSDLRSVGDYGGLAHVSETEARKAVADAFKMDWHDVHQ